MQRLQLIKDHLKDSSKEDNLMIHSSIISKQKRLLGKVIVITGGSRGIGLAIAKKLSLAGAHIAILGKTVIENEKLPGTIYTAAKEIEQLGGKALPLQCDVRDEKSVKLSINKIIETFGQIDILINNASAIYLKSTLETDMKKYDLIHNIVIRGTFMVTKYCLPYLIKSSTPAILNITQPLDIQPKRFAKNIGYNMAKQMVAMCTIGWAEEFKSYGIAVNGLWPLTGIATSAVKNLFGGDAALKYCRKETIMADAAYILLININKENTGKFYIDEDVLKSIGVTNFDQYKFDPDIKDDDIKSAKLK